MGADIEEIHFEEDIEIDFGREEGEWKALAACHQLRSLSLQPLDPRTELPAAFLAALASLPHFRSLKLLWLVSQPFMPTLLRYMAESRSWSELHLRCPCFSTPHYPLKHGGKGAGLNAQLAALQLDDRTAERIQLFVHQTRSTSSRQKMTCFRISSVDEATGKRVWEKQLE